MKRRYICPAWAALLFAGAAAAQTPFTSGSTGADGALNYTTPGTVLFDPANLGLNPAGDNVFQFTTINIGPNVTLKLTSNLMRGKPVVFLATGNVTIAGQINLDGATAPTLSSFGADWITQRVPSQPGPGGFPGGVGARPGSSASPGLGPGGAPVQTNTSCNVGGAAASGTAGTGIPAPTTYGNTQLVPLIGGSGGGGGCVAPSIIAADAAGGTGGAGGGAIRIVSTTSIAVTGSITALGGGGGGGRSGGTTGGGGSGGAVNLIAPTISGNGVVNVSGGGNGGYGFILLNTAANNFTGSLSSGLVTKTVLLAPPLPTASTVPTITVTSVNGVSVAQPAQGAFLTPDVTINAASAVTINISAVAVPVGTVVQLNIVSELGADQNVSCTPLAGTLASSTATCSASFPTSVSRILASASW
jgi:hypothetical protein